MVRTAVRVAVAAGVLALSLTVASEARAAGQVVVSVSPSVVKAGDQAEVLLRTFIPIEPQGPFADRTVRPYPVPSRYWSVWMPWEDYPFDS